MKLRNYFLLKRQDYIGCEKTQNQAVELLYTAPVVIVKDQKRSGTSMLVCPGFTLSSYCIHSKLRPLNVHNIDKERMSKR